MGRRRLMTATTAALWLGAFALGACGNSNDSNDAGSDTAATTTTQQAASGGMPAAGGGLSVKEAQTTTATETLLVRGFVVSSGGTTKLCESLDDSTTPPKCGGASMELKGYDTASLDGSSGDAKWSRSEVSVLADRENGTLVVSSTSR